MAPEPTEMVPGNAWKDWMSAAAKRLMVKRSNLFSSIKLTNLECIRRIIAGRLKELGMKEFRLPSGVEKGEPHSTIMISQDFWDRKKVLVLSSDVTSQLGLWSTRSITEGTPLNVGAP